MDNLPVTPATSVQEIENWLQPFVEAGVPVMEPVIDDDHRFVAAWGK